MLPKYLGKKMTTLNTQNYEANFSIVGFLKGLIQALLIVVALVFANKYIAFLVFISFFAIHFAILRTGKDKENSGAVYFMIFSAILLMGLFGSVVDSLPN